MLRSFGYAILAFVIVAATGYLGDMFANGFNNPIAPFESTLCLFFMLVTPAVAIILCIKLYRTWRHNGTSSK